MTNGGSVQKPIEPILAPAKVMISKIGNKTFGADLPRTKVLEWAKLLTVAGGGQMAVQLLGFACGVLVIRMLSQEQYALYTIANAMLGTLAVLADGGISTGVMSQGGKVWNDRSKLGSVLVTGIRLRSRFAIATILFAMPVLAYLLRDHGAGWLVVGMISLSLIPAFLAGLTETILNIAPKLHQNVAPLQAIQVGASGMRLGLSAVSLFFLPLAPVAMLAAGLPQIMANRRLRRLVGKNADLGAPYDPAEAHAILKSVRRILPGAIYFSFSGQISIWLLSMFGSTDSVAQIGGLSRLTMPLSAIGLIVGILVVPRFSRIAGGVKEVRSFFLKFTVCEVGLMLMLLAVVYISAPLLLMLLGSGYENLEVELLLLFGGAAMGLLKGTWFSLFASRGLILPALASVGINLATQAAGFALFDLSDLRSVIILAALMHIPEALLIAAYGWRKTLTHSNQPI